MTDRKKRLAALVRRMDDGMGVIWDDDGHGIGRFAHFADGKHGRNVYTSESEEPDACYAGWERLLTYDLDRELELWPYNPIEAAADV